MSRMMPGRAPRQPLTSRGVSWAVLAGPAVVAARLGEWVVIFGYVSIEVTEAYTEGNALVCIFGRTCAAPGLCLRAPYTAGYVGSEACLWRRVRREPAMYIQRLSVCALRPGCVFVPLIGTCLELLVLAAGGRCSWAGSAGAAPAPAEPLLTPPPPPPLPSADPSRSLFMCRTGREPRLHSRGRRNASARVRRYINAATSEMRETLPSPSAPRAAHVPGVNQSKYENTQRTRRGISTPGTAAAVSGWCN